MDKYFQKEYECMKRSELEELQNERLVRQVKFAYNNISYYKNKMNEKKVKPSDIKSIKDLYKLPFITKDDLRETYPNKMFAVNNDKIVRIHSTSGTTGKRVIVGYTKKDIDIWSDCVARAIVAAGGSDKDIIQISFGYGLFTGGMGINDGASKLGCMVIPMSTGNTDRQLQFMEDMGTTMLCATPSYVTYLIEKIKENNLLDKIKLKIGIFGAEPWTEEMRHNIENDLHIKAYDIYGLTELSGPGIAYECEMQDGCHINEDHFIAEIIDKDTFEPLPYGSKGELVLTSLTKEAFPIIRYRTKDICILNNKPCECGRTFVKMSKPMGRSDDMLIIKGVNVFPSQIESVLIKNGYSSNYQIIVDRINNVDKIEILVEIPDGTFTGSVSKLTSMEQDLYKKMEQMLGISSKIRLVAKRSLERSENKSKRIIDKRWEGNK